MASIKVGVLRGGPSDEHAISLKTGEAVLSGLPERYSPQDIFIAKNGDWYFNRVLSRIDKVLRSVDVVFNALHGHFGEDGKIQQILEHYKMPYTGSRILSSAVGMNKILSREIFERGSLKIPRAFVVRSDEEEASDAVQRIFKAMGPSWVVKPASSGSSVGVSIVHDVHNLEGAIEGAFKFDSRVLVEEYIKGREATCGVIESFRNEEYYTLPVVEIIPPAKHKFFSLEAKYSGETREVCPGNFDSDIKHKIEMLARDAHIALGCRHYSRADFIISDRPSKDKGQVYLLEVNTLPGLTPESLLPKAIEAVGSSYSEFLDHLIRMAMKKK